jgi:hypothetical protein
MAKRRRRRAKWYVGGGIVLILLFVLGDPYGTFRIGDDGDETSGRPDREVAAAAPGGEARTTPPDPVPNATLASGGPGISGGIPPGGEGRRLDSGTDADSRAASVAQIDETVGIIHRYEQALSADRLAELAVLVERVRRRPIEAPPSLAERWRAVRARAEAALQFGERLRTMVRGGEILRAHRLLVPLLQSTTPSWMRDRLDTAAKSFGWPSFTRDWNVRTGDVKVAGTPLERLRRVRFVKDDALQEGHLWRSGEKEATVRVSGLGGYTFPVVPRHAVEPVDPNPQDAISQGVAAARADDPRSVMLWCCFCHEQGDTAAAARLRAMLKCP